VDIWHNCMYESYTFIAKKLFNVYLVFNNSNIIVVTTTVQLYKKSNVVNYMSKYGAYKLLYTKHIRTMV
jgi:hypothetical protein